MPSGICSPCRSRVIGLTAFPVTSSYQSCIKRAGEAYRSQLLEGRSELGMRLEWDMVQLCPYIHPPNTRIRSAQCRPVYSPRVCFIQFYNSSSLVEALHVHRLTPASMNTITVPFTMAGIGVSHKGLSHVRLVQDSVAMVIYQLLHFMCNVPVVQHSNLLPLMEVLHGSAGDGVE